MLIISITIVMASLVLLIASYFDIRTGEIPDKIGFGLISIPLLTSMAYSFFRNDYSFFIASISLGIAYFIVGYIPFRLGQWGGGDLKLLSGIGCTLGFLIIAGYFKETVIPSCLFYFVNMGMVAFPYALLYAFILSFKPGGVFHEFRNYFRKTNYIVLVIFSFIPSILALLLKPKILIAIYLLPPLFIFASFYLRAFEKIALRQTIHAVELHEGDVVAEDLISEGKIIASKRCIEGLTQNQIERIQKLSSEERIPDRITIKKGIKFVPILFIAFLFTVLAGNMMDIIFNLLFGSP